MTIRKPIALKDRVRHYRLERHWSQPELAKRTGLSLRTIKRIEAGEHLSGQTEFDIERFMEPKEAIAS